MSRQLTEASSRWDRGDELTEWTAGDDQFPIDVIDEGESLVTTIDLPGFDREDVSIHLHDQTLRIEADRTSELDETEGTYVRRERRRRAMTRTVQLPDPVDETDISATMSNGVITITLPKRVPNEGHEIDISVD